MTTPTPAAKTSLLEWTSAAIGLVLLMIVLTVTVQGALDGSDVRPPEIRVEARRILPSGHGFLVEFDAVNSGGSTAAAVQVEATLTVPGQQAETTSATLDYVAADAHVSGGMFFARDPRSGKLEIRALGYQEP